MKRMRLSALICAMLLLAALRFALPPRAAEPVIAQAIVTRGSPGLLPTERIGPPSDALPPLAVMSEPDEPGDAFQVRVQEAKPPEVPVPVATKVATVVLPPPLPAQAPVPQPPDVALSLQVIGTYDDGGAPAVFLATPAGTIMARPGSLLMDQFRITGITANQVAIIELSTQRVLQLPVPGRSHL